MFVFFTWVVAAVFCMPTLVRAFTTNDVNLYMNSYSNAFYRLSGTNAWFKDIQNGGTSSGNRTYFWGQAEEIECIEDAYMWTSNSTYKVMITNLLNGFKNNEGSSWSGNPYNDDVMWAVLAFAKGYLITGHTPFRDIAKANYDMCYARGWDNTGAVVPPAGGFYWTTDNNSKNSAVNFPAANAAYMVYLCTGDASYLTKATNTFSWGRSNLVNIANGQVYDSINNHGPTTYNQGTYIGICDSLGQTNEAILAADYTMNSMTTGGILPQYGIDQNNSGFNAIFIRWAARFMKQRNLQSRYQAWLQQNANAAWNLRRLSDNLSWCQWRQQTISATNFHSWDCIASLEALVSVPATQNASPGAVTLLASDSLGTSSFAAAGNWSDITAPSWTNNYIVNGRELRTPNDSVIHHFLGSALILTNGGALRLMTSAGAPINFGTLLSVQDGIVSAAVRPAVLNGAVTLGTNGPVFDPQGFGGFTVQANLSGPGGLTVASDNNTFGGTLVLAGYNTYLGDTILNGPDTLMLSNNATLGSTNGDFIFENNGDGLTIPHTAYGNANYGTLNLNGTDLSIGSLIGGGGRVTDNFSGETNVLTVGNGNADGGNFQGIIQDHTATGGTIVLVKVGTGTQTLSGTNTYTGGTLISAGTLQLGDGVTRNGVLAGNITNNSTLIFANAWNQSQTTAIVGSGQLIKNGAGTLTLTTAHNYQGKTTLRQGMLALSGGGALTNSSGLEMTNGVTLEVTGRPDQTLTLINGQTMTGSGTINGQFTVLSGAKVNVMGALAVQGSVTLNGQLLMDINRTNGCDQLTASGLISGGGSLTVSNLGPALQAGDRFQLFSQPVGGFTNTSLPLLTGPNTWLNLLSVDGTLRVVSPLFLTQTNIEVQTIPTGLSLSWPADHLGWRLQVQTNDLSMGLSTNWIDVPNSSTTNQLVLPLNPVANTVFFRLIFP